jgi:Xaa-Pro aminopeptidase
MGNEILREKLAQAPTVMKELDIDCWLTFVSESSVMHDPAMDLIVGHDVTWGSAFFVMADGRRVAIVGSGDASLVKAAGLYESLHTYDANLKPVFRKVLRELDPQRIAINYSRQDALADGLTHGMWLNLMDLMARTPYHTCLVSSGPLMDALRSRKSGAELERMRRAIAITEELFAMVGPFLRPGRTEREVAEMLHAEVTRRGLKTAWQWDACPMVNAGPTSEAGHGGPTAIAMQPGDLIHLDFGVIYEGYCSDLQRMWYLPSKADPTPPAHVRKAFHACKDAIEAARKSLRAGVSGYMVDATARASLVKDGFPEYMHALGHSVGMAVHDGGPLIGPRWERYGDSPMRPIQPGSIYTLELDTETDRGTIGLEDMVLVSERGAAWFSEPQRDLIIAG